MTAYHDAAARALGSFTTDMGLLAICAEPFPRNTHAAAALLTCLVGWQEYVIEHDINVHDGECWVFMTDSDWERYCGVSRGQASRIMGTFEELGWVLSIQQPRAAGRSKRPVTWYRLVPEAFPEAPSVARLRPTSARHANLIGTRDARDLGSAPSSSKSLTTEPSKRAIPRDALKVWEPTAELWDWTSKTNPRVGRGDLDQFRDHHVAKGTRIIDIDATWRNWVRNTLRFGAVGDGQARRARLDSSFDDVAAAFLAAEAERERPAQLELGS